MNLLKLARQIALQIKQASVQNYKALLNANEQAQAAAIDPYDDMTPEESKQLKDIAKIFAIVTDKAYRQGVPGTEIRYMLEKAKKSAINLYGKTNNQAIKKDLGSLLGAANKVQYIEIPSQMVGSAATVSTPKNNVETSSNDSYNDNQTQKMLDVAKGLANVDRDPYRSLSNQPAGDVWETPGDPSMRPF